MRKRNIHQVLPDNEANASRTERQPLLKPPTTSVVTLNDYDEDDDYADCIKNPGRYNRQLCNPAGNNIDEP